MISSGGKGEAEDGAARPVGLVGKRAAVLLDDRAAEAQAQSHAVGPRGEKGREQARGHLFAQQYVRQSGHCTFTQDQIRSAFGQLLRWRRTGARPTPGAVPPWDGATR